MGCQTSECDSTKCRGLILVPCMVLPTIPTALISDRAAQLMTDAERQQFYLTAFAGGPLALLGGKTDFLQPASFSFLCAYSKATDGHVCLLARNAGRRSHGLTSRAH